MEERIKVALKQRKSVSDPFRNTNGYGWDYCMVFKVQPIETTLSEEQKKFSLKSLLNKMADAGLQTKLFYSVQHDEVYCKIRCSLVRLLKEADRVNYRLQLDPVILCNVLLQGNLKGPPEKRWAPINMPTNSHETDIDPYEHIYMDYRCENPADKTSNFNDTIYKSWPNNSKFRGVDRLKLIALILKARISEGGCQIDCYKLIKNKCMISFFPLHDAVELLELEDKWLQACQLPWRQNVTAVKDYYGEKIGMYFTYLGHYTTWLIYAAIGGFIGWIGVAGDNSNPSAPVIPYLCVFIAVWCTLFLEFWKRTEKTTAMKWGMVGFEEDEQDRPEFEGEVTLSPVTGRPFRYFPRKHYLFRQTISISIVLALISLVLAVIVGIFVLRVILTHSQALVVGGIALGGTIVGLINAVQIQLLNALYTTVAVKLTDYENHRTDTEYEDSLIGKTFAFTFINSFSMLFYTAFVKPYINTIDPCVNSCMSELSNSLGTIFLTRLATGSLLKVLMPQINKYMRKRNESKGFTSDNPFTEVELAFMQEEYHVTLGTFQDFADLTIQFGYATMFVAAYPLSTAVALVNNYVGMRVDAWRLCHLMRRPEPRSNEDIGTWYSILEIISTAAVITNSALVAFTATNAINQTWATRVWIFIVMGSGILLIKKFIADYVPDVPREVEIQLERQKLYVDKIMHNIPDDEDEDFKTKQGESTYPIKRTDDDPL